MTIVYTLTETQTVDPVQSGWRLGFLTVVLGVYTSEQSTKDKAAARTDITLDWNQQGNRLIAWSGDVRYIIEAHQLDGFSASGLGSIDDDDDFYDDHDYDNDDDDDDDNPLSTRRSPSSRRHLHMVK